jgi:hypothetical protein
MPRHTRFQARLASSSFSSSTSSVSLASLLRTTSGGLTSLLAPSPAMVSLALRSSSGQAVMIMGAVALIAFMGVVGFSLSQSSNSHAKLMINEATANQLKLTAQAGLQEALATRFYPRSNYLNFSALTLPPAPPASQQPFYKTSGRLFSGTNLIGMYRYVVLGGDSARNPSTAVFNPSDIVRITSSSSKVDQPFVVLSQGAVCVSPDGQNIVPNAFSVSGFVPSCNAGSTLRTITFLSSSRLDGSGAGGQDVLDTMRMVSNPASITLPTNVVMPDGTRTNTVNFETAWGAANAASHATPDYVMSYSLADQTAASPAVQVTGSTVTIPGTVAPNHAIRVYMRGEYDYRSLYNYNPATCISNPSTCAVKIEQRNADWTPTLDGGGNRVVFGVGSLMPVLPSGTQLIAFPPQDPAAAMAFNTNYAIVIDGNVLQDSRGKKSGSTYEVRFSVAAPPATLAPSQTDVQPPNTFTYDICTTAFILGAPTWPCGPASGPGPATGSM